MVVQHNLRAMNSNRMLGLTNSTQAKSTEKLSSGYRINRAADDAAGLAISEKMRKQIRGLSQAAANAQDGISAVQTAEGALNEVQDMLQRMNELAVKAANGSNSDSDRSAIQDEINQLSTEIDRVSTTTKFNETYLLKGVGSDGTAGKLTYTTANANVGANTFDAKGMKEITLAAKADGTALGTDGSNKTDYKKVEIEFGGKKYAVISDIKAADCAVEGKSNTAMSFDELKAAYDDLDANKTAKSTAYASLEDAMKAIRKDFADDIKNVSSHVDGTNTIVKVEAFADLNSAADLSLHVGADSSDDNKITMNIANLSARGLGVNGLRVDGDNADNATAAVDTIAAALQKVSDQRASLGAIQNRLEHTIANLDNVVENTTSAESAIRDTDMAKEMVAYSNQQILAQAGISMLAQSNQANQGILSLLG